MTFNFKYFPIWPWIMPLVPLCHILGFFIYRYIFGNHFFFIFLLFYFHQKFFIFIKSCFLPFWLHYHRFRNLKHFFERIHLSGWKLTPSASIWTYGLKWGWSFEILLFWFQKVILGSKPLIFCCLDPPVFLRWIFIRKTLLLQISLIFYLSSLNHLPGFYGLRWLARQIAFKIWCFSYFIK